MLKSNKAPFHFQPFTIKQKLVLEWWLPGSPYEEKDGIICDGSVRSGKTTVMVLSFVMWAMYTFNGENFGLCGKTVQSARRNIVKPLKRMLAARGYIVEDHKAENFLTIRMEGTENDFYLFGGKDESSQDLIQGITLAGVFLDECALMPESFVNQATARCSVAGSKLWFNCNPEGPDHYIKTEWIDRLKEKNLIRIHFVLRDNPSLSETILKRYENMYQGVFYRIYINGSLVYSTNYQSGNQTFTFTGNKGDSIEYRVYNKNFSSGTLQYSFSIV